jgi:hypothetical protein
MPAFRRRAYPVAIRAQHVAFGDLGLDLGPVVAVRDEDTHGGAFVASVADMMELEHDWVVDAARAATPAPEILHHSRVIRLANERVSHPSLCSLAADIPSVMGLLDAAVAFAALRTQATAAGWVPVEGGGGSHVARAAACRAAFEFVDLFHSHTLHSGVRASASIGCGASDATPLERKNGPVPCVGRAA